MKRIRVLLLFVFVFCLLYSVFICADEAFVFDDGKERVIDNADLLSDEEENAFRIRISEIAEKRSVDVVILTVESTEGKSAEQFADDFYDYGGYGKGIYNSGEVFLISIEPENHVFYISTTGLEIERLENEIDSICDSVKEYLSLGDFGSAVNVFLDKVDYDYAVQNDSVQSTARSVDVKSILIKLAICVFFGFLISLLIVLVMKSKMVNIHTANNAFDYLKRDSVDIHYVRSVFIRSDLAVTPRPQNNYSSGNGNTHIGSSGTHHGGGGGSF